MAELNWSHRNCSACQAELRATDKFCRQCGVKQEPHEWAAQVAQCPTTSMSLNTGPRAGAVTDNFTKAPAAASAHETNSLSRPVSGQLLKAVADGVAIKRAVGGYSSITRNIVLALMSVPVWLMIVLLSPLDAWAATREIARQM